MSSPLCSLALLIICIVFQVGIDILVLNINYKERWASFSLLEKIFRIFFISVRVNRPFCKSQQVNLLIYFINWYEYFFKNDTMKWYKLFRLFVTYILCLHLPLISHFILFDSQHLEVSKHWNKSIFYGSLFRVNSFGHWSYFSDIC